VIRHNVSLLPKIPPEVYLKVVFFSLLATSLSFSQLSPVGTAITLDELAIEVSGTSREVAFTNKNAGVLYTETGSEHRSGWQGWRVYSRKMLEDYYVVAGGIPLSRKDVQRSVVTPYQLKRYYANGIEETVTLLDSLNALVIEVDHVTAPDIVVVPLPLRVKMAPLAMLTADAELVPPLPSDNVP